MKTSNTGYWQHFLFSHGERKKIFQTTKYTKNTKAENGEMGNLSSHPLHAIKYISYRKDTNMIPTIERIMKTYPLIAQMERAKTGRPGDGTERERSGPQVAVGNGLF